ncbi:AGE family epimerase/isomerase [Xanthocytophaga flava]|uniref:AGE family epimerase/isomerase n=1 Tax=Xanthocytophaga flava TaxID=3048013 RepID=UPI0028D187D3|nr:AGE family epimerase/isomerase [Xanthocytophaga flavus]MDJ1473633.1 AGE family epimerase/isomerase [Xanthocytophaga flavus]
MQTQSTTVIESYAKELENELFSILDYWRRFTVDDIKDGFYGQIDEDNNVHPTAPKGSVLNARILWTFSAAYQYTPNPEYLIIADRAYHYILDHFIDPVYGGVYWSVDYEGNPLDTKKQIYALSFTIYGLTEYYRATEEKAALHTAIELFELIEKYSYDPDKGGYFEAFNREWQTTDDLRLSAKDANEKKTMNTHLHILEAYTNLYRVWKNEVLKRQIYNLLTIFTHHIIDPDTNHQILFFDEDWKAKSDIISFGHDIEASWLLMEAAELLDDHMLLNLVREKSIALARSSEKGLDTDGGMWYELETQSNHWMYEKHWWVQAEAMVGFFKAYQLTNESHFLDKSLNCWEFVKKYGIDHTYGEWYWAIMADYRTMANQDKAGLWKCPYHNSRACLEIIHTASLYKGL